MYKLDNVLVAVIGEGCMDSTSEKILLVIDISDISIDMKSIKEEINRFFPGTIGFFDKLFQREKYVIYTFRKTAFARFVVAIGEMLKKADWNFCAMEIVGDEVVSRYAHGSGIVYNTHRLKEVVVMSTWYFPQKKPTLSFP